MPGLWQGVTWARQRGNEGGGISQTHLVARTVWATLTHGAALRRWMTVAFELKSRGVIDDLPGEYLRALRPYVHRGTGVNERVVQLIDHIDWVETAFHSWALEKITDGQPLVLADLKPPRGYEYMRLQLQRAPVQAPEGELLLTLALLRSPDVQHKAQPVEAAALIFSRFRIDGKGCLVIGGVRGQRDPVNRLSPVELNQALQGWKPSVLMVRVAQELARYWGLHLVGLDPGWHRLHAFPNRLGARAKENAKRIDASYDALWDHFDAHKGPSGWMVLPLNSDEKLAATALSPEKRERQTRRADYWIRTRKLLHAEFKALLQRPGREAQLSRVTESMGPGTVAPEDSYFDEEFLESGEDAVPSRVLETGPGSLI
jgi:uncharacterized protein VirK/YbjX